jgi:hypothetical protein
MNQYFVTGKEIQRSSLGDENIYQEDTGNEKKD